MPTWLIIVIAATISYLSSLIVRVMTSREKKVQYLIEHTCTAGDEQFLRAMSSLLPPAALGGNKITTYTNGDKIFPAMLDAIRSAQRTITIETFIYWRGEIGLQFADALSERARAKVKVHVLLDWVGTKKMDAISLRAMKAAGVEVQHYHPLRWHNVRRFNNRTHRKLLVVDGMVGFTGGVGIADEWMGHGQDANHRRDSHYKMEGPVVAQCQAAFMDNWLKTRSLVLPGEGYFPKLAHRGPHRAQVIISSPSEGSDNLKLMYLLAITSAKHSIRIGSAYFVPDNLSVQTLIDALGRGVKVVIIVSGEHHDQEITRRSGRSRWKHLMHAGAEIYEYQPSLYHCKVMIVDDFWTSIGSANFDSRSFRLNDEANLNVYDTDFTREQINVFERDQECSRRITFEERARQPWSEKLKDRAAGILRSQL